MSMNRGSATGHPNHGYINASSIPEGQTPVGGGASVQHSGWDGYRFFRGRSVSQGDTIDLYEVSSVGDTKEGLGLHLPSSGCVFRGLVLLSQLVGVGAVVMIGIWVYHFRGGFAWQDDPSLEFNYHPLFMVLGMVFLCGEGLLVYRVFSDAPKGLVRTLHGCFHVASLASAGFGLKVAIDYHDLPKKPTQNFYSLHSWLGTLVIGCFLIQGCVGLMSLLLPTAKKSIRSAYTTIYNHCGIGILVTATANALIGMTQKALLNANYDTLPAEGYLINFIGLALFLFTALVVSLVTRAEWKRVVELKLKEKDHEDTVIHRGLFE